MSSLSTTSDVSSSESLRCSTDNEQYFREYSIMMHRGNRLRRKNSLWAFHLEACPSSQIPATRTLQVFWALLIRHVDCDAMMEFCNHHHRLAPAHGHLSHRLRHSPREGLHTSYLRVYDKWAIAPRVSVSRNLSFPVS